MEISNNNILRSIFLMTLSAVSLMVGAQELKIEVDAPNKLKVGDTFRIKYVVSSANDIKSKMDAISIGTIDGCELLYGPARTQSVTTRIEGDKKTEIISIADVYTMQAIKAGKYTIPSATVIIDGKKHKSKTSKIEVLSVAKGNNRTIQFPDESKEGEETFIRTIVSRKRVSTTDTLMVVYRLYTKLDVDNIIDANYPSLKKDFYSRDITPKYVLFRDDIVGETEYTTIDIRTVILQPKAEGLKKIPDGDVEIEFTIPTGEKVKTYTGEVDVIKKEKRRLRLDGAIIEVMNLIGV